MSAYHFPAYALWRSITIDFERTVPRVLRPYVTRFFSLLVLVWGAFCLVSFGLFCPFLFRFTVLVRVDFSRFCFNFEVFSFLVLLVFDSRNGVPMFSAHLKDRRVYCAVSFLFLLVHLLLLLRRSYFPTPLFLGVAI